MQEKKQIPELEHLRELKHGAPDGYFEKLPDQIMHRINKPEQATKPLVQRKFMQWVAAAAIFAGIGLLVAVLLVKPENRLPVMTINALAAYSDISSTFEEWINEIDWEQDGYESLGQDLWALNTGYAGNKTGNSEGFFTKNEVIEYLFDNGSDQIFLNL